MARGRLQRYFKLVFAGGLALLLFYAVAGVLMSEMSIHFPRRPLDSAVAQQAQAVAASLNTDLETVEVAAADGASLRAWLFRNTRAQGDFVILLHGQGDNREGVLAYVGMFLRHRYNVLTPDSRGHGESGGNLTTYGFLEAHDVRRWVSWLYEKQSARCVYGLGESMGAAILLQALPRETRLCAAVAESPFSNLREIAYDRVGQKFGVGPWAGRTIFRPVVEFALLWARAKYGVDFDAVSPEEAVAASETPVLLIHGVNDKNIPIRHSRRIARCHRAGVHLWEVPEAGHTGSYSHRPEEFERRVCHWFQTGASSE